MTNEFLSNFTYDFVTSPSTADLKTTECTNDVVWVNENPQYWLLVLYCIYFLLGVFGNGCLVLLFFLEKSLRDVNNAFLTNLALSDFLFIIVFVPVKFYEELYYARPFGFNVCVVTILINYSSQDVSTMSLTMLSYLRYRAVVDPFSSISHNRHRKMVIISMCFLSWAIGLGCAIFPAVYCTEQMTECEETLVGHYINIYDDKRLHWRFFWVRLVIFYLLPLVAITLFYGLMARTLYVGSRVLRKTSISTQDQNKSRKKLGVIIFVIIMVFFLSWLPNYLTWLIGLYDGNFMLWTITTRNVTIYLPSVTNVFVLLAMSSNHRRYFRKYFFPCCPSLRRFTATSGKDMSKCKTQKISVSTTLGDVTSGDNKADTKF